VLSVICFSSEVANNFWSWLTDSLEVVTMNSSEQCIDKQKEVVQGV